MAAAGYASEFKCGGMSACRVNSPTICIRHGRGCGNSGKATGRVLNLVETCMVMAPAVMVRNQFPMSEKRGSGRGALESVGEKPATFSVRRQGMSEVEVKCVWVGHPRQERKEGTPGP